MRGGSRRATQWDIAREAGVSQATVSLVLRGVDSLGIAAATSARVRETAQALGYAPNRSARTLRTHQAEVIAVVVPDIGNPFYSSLLRGVQSVSDRAGYDVMTINTDGRAERERRVLTWGLEGRVDGVTGVFFTLRATDFRPLADAGVAVVRIESVAKRDGQLPIDNLYVDNRAAAAAATRYLLERGRRQIAMIAGQGGPQDERSSGYAQALSACGLAPRLLIDAEFTETGGYRATLRMLDEDGRPDAIFAANDLMAIGAMAALRERGLSIPRDVAVIGFDDILVARLVTPALTTVSQFQQDLGAVAAETLLARLHHWAPAHGTSREMPYQLIERAST